MAAKRVYYNRVRETCTNPGTALNVSLTGATTGHVTLGSRSGLAVGDVFDYVLENQTDNTWEIGLGTWQGSNSFDRTEVYENSSGTTARLDFSSGTLHFWVDHPGQGVLDAYGSFKNAASKQLLSSAVITNTFLVDLALDSDLGAWAKKAQHTSWYKELGPMPRLMFGVLTDASMYLYDATQAHMPLWAQFNEGGSDHTTNNLIGDASGTNHAATYLDGRIYLARSVGYRIIDFILDRGRRVSNVDTRQYLGNIEQRNDGLGTVVVSADSLADADVKSISAIVYSDAPVDPATGLKTPSLLISEDAPAGIELLQNDGSYYSATGLGSAKHVSLYGTSAYATRGSASNRLYYARNMDSVSVAFAMANYGADTVPAVFPFVSLGVTGGCVGMPNDQVALGGEAGLNVVAEDTGTPANGMVRYVTKDYATGWMQGDVELHLCDSLTDRSISATSVSDAGSAVIAAIATGAEQKRITATGGDITATVTTGGAIYGWELVSGVWYFRADTGWVGVSESGGTLTIADGTTFAMLTYVNGGGPSAAQFAKIELDEHQIMQPDSDCLLAGTSNKSTGISYDPVTGKLDVATADGISTFSGLQRVAYLDSTDSRISSDTGVAVKRSSDAQVVATAAEAAGYTAETQLD